MMDTTVLVLEDGRGFGKSRATGTTDYTPNGYEYTYDWRVWSSAGFGRRLQNALPKSNGYYSEVLDCGKYVVVKASYTNVATGKTVGKQFIVVFDNANKGDGKVFSTSTKWRTISSVEQATSYISSYISSLASSTNNA